MADIFEDELSPTPENQPDLTAIAAKIIHSYRTGQTTTDQLSKFLTGILSEVNSINLSSNIYADLVDNHNPFGDVPHA